MPHGKRRQAAAAVDGMLLLDKPDGLSSNQALQQAKRLLSARKAGHTGSLDPIATGLLPLCFGETTRISSFFLNADKCYRATLRLGVSTDTGDREGRVVGEAGIDFSRRQLGDALDRFRGRFEQIPPMYSALKKNGRPLYKLAREGVTVERAPRPVTVHDLSLEAWHGNRLDLTISCSHGFYVRTLASDLGDALGCGAHVCELRRTAVGDLSVENAHTLAQIEALGSPGERQKLLLPTDRVLTRLPAVNLPDNTAFYLCRGQSVRAPAAHGFACGLVRVYSDSGGFLGLAEITDDGKVAPRRLFQTA